jgi:hypothetical protein
MVPPSGMVSRAGRQVGKCPLMIYEQIAQGLSILAERRTEQWRSGSEAGKELQGYKGVDTAIGLQQGAGQRIYRQQHRRRWSCL